MVDQWLNINTLHRFMQTTHCIPAHFGIVSLKRTSSADDVKTCNMGENNNLTLQSLIRQLSSADQNVLIHVVDVHDKFCQECAKQNSLFSESDTDSPKLTDDTENKHTEHIKDQRKRNSTDTDHFQGSCTTPRKKNKYLSDVQQTDTATDNSDSCTESQAFTDYTSESDDSTTTSQKWPIQLFKKWLKKVGESPEFESMPVDKIVKLIGEMAATRGSNKTSFVYSNYVMKSIKVAVFKHLKNEPYKRDITHAFFRKCKNTEINSKEAKVCLLTEEDIKTLYSSRVFGKGDSFTAMNLLYKVWFDVSLHFGIICRKKIISLKKDEIKLATDENGHLFCTYYANEMAANRWMDSPRIYSTPDNPFCPLRSILLYVSHLNSWNDSFFQKPLSLYRKEDKVWYSSVPWSYNILQRTISDISKKAGLERNNINTSVRETARYVLNNAGLWDENEYKIEWVREKGCNVTERKMEIFLKLQEFVHGEKPKPSKVFDTNDYLNLPPGSNPLYVDGTLTTKPPGSLNHIVNYTMDTEQNNNHRCKSLHREELDNRKAASQIFEFLHQNPKLNKDANANTTSHAVKKCDVPNTNVKVCYSNTNKTPATATLTKCTSGVPNTTDLSHQSTNHKLEHNVEKQMTNVQQVVQIPYMQPSAPTTANNAIVITEKGELKLVSLTVPQMPSQNFAHVSTGTPTKHCYNMEQMRPHTYNQATGIRSPVANRDVYVLNQGHSMSGIQATLSTGHFNTLTNVPLISAHNKVPIPRVNQIPSVATQYQNIQVVSTPNSNIKEDLSSSRAIVVTCTNQNGEKTVQIKGGMDTETPAKDISHAQVAAQNRTCEKSEVVRPQDPSKPVNIKHEKESKNIGSQILNKTLRLLGEKSSQRSLESNQAIKSNSSIKDNKSLNIPSENKSKEHSALKKTGDSSSNDNCQERKSKYIEVHKAVKDQNNTSSSSKSKKVESQPKSIYDENRNVLIVHLDDKEAEKVAKQKHKDKSTTPKPKKCEDQTSKRKGSVKKVQHISSVPKNVGSKSCSPKLRDNSNGEEISHQNKTPDTVTVHEGMKESNNNNNGHSSISEDGVSNLVITDVKSISTFDSQEPQNEPKFDGAGSSNDGVKVEPKETSFDSTLPAFHQKFMQRKGKIAEILKKIQENSRKIEMIKSKRLNSDSDSSLHQGETAQKEMKEDCEGKETLDSTINQHGGEQIPVNKIHSTEKDNLMDTSTTVSGNDETPDITPLKLSIRKKPGNSYEIVKSKSSKQMVYGPSFDDNLTEGIADNAAETSDKDNTTKKSSTKRKLLPMLLPIKKTKTDEGNERNMSINSGNGSFRSDLDEKGNISDSDCSLSGEPKLIQCVNSSFYYFDDFESD